MPSTLSLLTDPDGFFERRTPNPSLKGPILVVAAIAAVDALASVLQFRFLSQIFEGAGVTGGLATALQAFTFAFVLVGPFAIWLLYAGVFHGISLVFDGEGEFSTTLAFVGWGLLPSVLGSIAGAAINFYRFNVREYEVPAEMTPQATGEFMQSLQTGPLVALTAALGIVFTLWSAFLWTFGLKHARNLSLKQAALTVAVPVLLSLLFSLRTLLNALEIL